MHTYCPISISSYKKTNNAIHSHKVFKGIAEIGKTTKGWLYGFKLHIICNHRGELVSCRITPDLFGKSFGDKGYISKELFDVLFN
jgi:hypothetical protein